MSCVSGPYTYVGGPSPTRPGILVGRGGEWSLRSNCAAGPVRSDLRPASSSSTKAIKPNSKESAEWTVAHNKHSSRRGRLASPPSLLLWEISSFCSLLAASTSHFFLLSAYLCVFFFLSPLSVGFVCEPAKFPLAQLFHFSLVESRFRGRLGWERGWLWVSCEILRDFATRDRERERERERERGRERKRDEIYGGWEGSDVAGTRNEQGVEL